MRALVCIYVVGVFFVAGCDTMRNHLGAEDAQTPALGIVLHALCWPLWLAVAVAVVALEGLP